MTIEPAVSFDRVTKRYPGVTHNAIDDLSLDILPGEIFSLLGPNGAGKTTTIEMLVGLRKPTTGGVRTLGVDPVRDRDVVRRRVSVQPQHAAVFEQQTVEELLRCWASFYPLAKSAGEVIEQMGLQACRGTRIAKLSGGQRQRVLVGLALVSRPDLLVLDEPSTGLDPNARRELWTALTDFGLAGGTVVLSTHSMEEAERLSTRVAILHQGRIAACGSPESLVAEHAPQREIACQVNGGADTSALQALAETVEISDDASGGTRLRVTTTDSDAVLAALSTTMGARNIHIRDAGLEGVFRTLTGRHLDDEEHETEPELATVGAKGSN